MEGGKAKKFWETLKKEILKTRRSQYDGKTEKDFEYLKKKKKKKFGQNFSTLDDLGNEKFKY